VLAIESFDASSSVDKLLFSCEERVTTRADFKPNLGFCRPSLPGFTARAMHRGRLVLGMYVWFHRLTAPVANLFIRRTIEISRDLTSVSSRGSRVGVPLQPIPAATNDYKRLTVD